MDRNALVLAYVTGEGEVLVEVLVKTASARMKMPGAIFINVAFSLWVLLSPFVLGFSREAAMVSNVAVGLLLLAVVFVATRFERALALDVLIGAWLFASPFVLGLGSNWILLWNNVLMAFAVIIAAVTAEGFRRTTVASRK